MIGIGMPMSQSRSPLPIVSSNADVFFAMEMREHKNGSFRIGRKFPQPSRRQRVDSLSTLRRMRMRKLAIGLVAAGTLITAAPAMAQVVLEGPGVGVRVGPEPYYRDYRDHDRWD